MPVAGAVVEVTVETIGARGDGIAHTTGGARLFVPLAVPGDRVRVRIGDRRGDGFQTRVVARLVTGPRAEPACPHFGHCGGCQLQHLVAPAYAAWKRAQVVAALARRGLDGIPVELPEIGPPASRRRVRLAFEPAPGGPRLGFRMRASRRLVDLVACPVVVPEIAGLVGPLRALLSALAMVGRGEVRIMASDAGLDVLIATAAAPGLEDRERLARFAAEQDLARLSWQAGDRGAPEPIAARRPALVRFGGVAVEPPPGAFLQASAFAEGRIRAALEPALGDAARIADLFAGCGTFALPLAAAGRRVHAVEAEAAMLAALERGARRADLATVSCEVRDLERAPLAGGELARFEAVILDPPRAGARAQAAALAASSVARIAMVSCHPATFARDARILIDGGHRLLRVWPIDAFLWSSQIELVGSFGRC